MSEPVRPADRATSNKRLAWIHVGLALAVLGGFVLNAVLK